jgi:hypothetical protein
MRKVIPVLFVFFLLNLPAKSQQDSILDPYLIYDSQQFDAELFESNEPLKVFLEFDISYYKKWKPQDAYIPATITYVNSSNDTVSKDFKLRARGNFRLRFCEFPPLMLNFKVKDMKGTAFSGIDKMKLVPHCTDGLDDYILREYLIYRMYNLITDQSLRVRLLEINYIDTRGKIKPKTEFGFVIEPYNLFEQRTGLTRVMNSNITQRNIYRKSMDRVAIFAYMTGNADWNVPQQHNIQIFAAPADTAGFFSVAVPYDFDYCGLVNAYYAVPPPEIGIKSFRERFYQGICRTNTEYVYALRDFVAQKVNIYKLISEFPYLKQSSKKDIISFIDQFYLRLDSKYTILSEFRETCKEIQY